KIILQHDNARPHVHKSVTNYLGVNWEILPNPPYSPDIAPSDYYLFRSMVSTLYGERFSFYEEIKNWFHNWIASKLPDFYQHGIRLLPERWAKVVASDGAYF
ncbi:Histone-lysine N-methyltransferase SETMAR, partial [Harpegnathos saltator]